MLDDKIQLLRPYQKKDAFFIAKRYACGVFNEQRTGKTPTTLIGFRAKKLKKILIICPASMLIPWKNEFEKWYEAPCIICSGTSNQRKRLIEQWTDGLVISYDCLKKTKTSKGSLEDVLKTDFDGIILDEAHRIKGRTTATAEAVFALKNKCKHKAALTGTPAPNYAHEVWPILHFLFPKYFRSYWNFVEEYFTVEERMNHQTLKTFKDIGTFKSAKAKKDLKTLLDHIAINRKRKEVMPWLPDKNYYDIQLEPTPLQKDCLYTLRNYFEIPNTDIICKGVLDRLTRYRQICVAPTLLNLGHSPIIDSAKLTWLAQFIKDYPEEPTIIFTNFTSVIKHITPLFSNYKYATITGSTTAKEREAIRRDFQAGCINFLIANITTCKEGITLDRAETIIFLDEYPPIATIEQAEDRFVITTHGKKKTKNRIIRLILKNTFEEDLRNLIKDHKSETDIINSFKTT